MQYKVIVTESHDQLINKLWGQINNRKFTGRLREQLVERIWNNFGTDFRNGLGRQLRDQLKKCFNAK